MVVQQETPGNPSRNGIRHFWMEIIQSSVQRPDHNHSKSDRVLVLTNEVGTPRVKLHVHQDSELLEFTLSRRHVSNCARFLQHRIDVEMARTLLDGPA